MNVVRNDFRCFLNELNLYLNKVVKVRRKKDEWHGEREVIMNYIIFTLWCFFQIKYTGLTAIAAHLQEDSTLFSILFLEIILIGTVLNHTRLYLN